LQAWITRKVGLVQISVSLLTCKAVGLHYPEPALTVIISPTDSLEETKQPHNKLLHWSYRWKIILMCLKILWVQEPMAV